MQEIKLVNYTPPDKRGNMVRDRFYHVSFPSKRFRFSNRKQMLSFFAEVNRQLNEKAHELNRLLIEVFAEFRYYYFHLTYAERQSIETDFAGITKMFGMLITRSQSTNGNYFTFDRFSKIIQYMIGVVETLQRNSMNRLATVQRYRLKTLINSIKKVDYELNTLFAKSCFTKFESY